ncbi:Thioredoxin-1 [Chromobacterium violaceum]|uniref:Thioredoxin n=3 Tax=Chromobacterium violaceum TaxID=536 RepID=A0A3S5DLD1_CHRVL|nr:Thioredoxin-1 [Chromobacterium violaceum]
MGGGERNFVPQVAARSIACYHPELSTLNLDEEAMSDLILHVTDDSFENEVLKADRPVLVDYWAEWCGPCKMIAPILDEVAKEYDGKLKIAKLNIDQNEQTPPKFGIRGIPTLMLFKDGQVAATKVGALSKSQLTAFIDSQL